MNTSSSGNLEPERQIMRSSAPQNLPLSHEALESLPFPLTICTCDGLCVGVNNLSEQLFRIPRAAVIGTLNVLTNATNQDTSRPALFAAAVAGKAGQSPPMYYDFSFPGSQGADRASCWVTISYFPFCDGDGHATHVGMMLQDVTEQVEAERKMSLFSALVENAHDGIGVTDLSGRITYCNPALGRLTGYGDQMIGKSLSDMHPDDMEVVAADHAQAMARGHWHNQMNICRADGSSLPADVAGFVLRDADGKPSSTAAIVRDLSAERAREQELRLVKFTLDRAADSIYWLKSDGQIAYANDTASTTLGYTREELLLLSIFDVAISLKSNDMGQIWTAIKHHQAQLFEGVQRRKDGREIPVEVVTNYLAFEGQEYACIFSRDISERRREEEDRLNLQEQVIAAQQAALRELSTPLIPIAEGVVAMPLIGSIDSGRAQMVIETLLTGVASLRAETTILDITGVPVVDTQVANALLRAAQAVKLLGARVILTGIRPEVAQTLVGLGVDLSGIITRGTLQDGIAEALGWQTGMALTGRR
ncbi:PAS domain S-box protein [Chloroflexales bacterium ZM16-3]|nr:PAS domain S-box protein [Chloroflexales bacterium ZM16-3]